MRGGNFNFTPPNAFLIRTKSSRIFPPGSNVSTLYFGSAFFLAAVRFATTLTTALPATLARFAEVRRALGVLEDLAEFITTL